MPPHERDRQVTGTHPRLPSATNGCSEYIVTVIPDRRDNRTRGAKERDRKARHRSRSKLLSTPAKPAILTVSAVLHLPRSTYFDERTVTHVSGLAPNRTRSSPTLTACRFRPETPGLEVDTGFAG